ncbi:protein translocase subunit SecDF [Clostridia bacterium]|nr:protein translocase subunit SecDF [Clostridia bacterium]
MNNITRKKGTFFAVLIITLFFAYISFFGLQLGRNFELKGAAQMRFGIDIKGGVDAAFSAKDMGADFLPTKDQLEKARTIIETRLDQQNILDRDVTIDEEGGYVLVRFPWKTGEIDFDPATAIKELGEMAHLTFKDPDGNVIMDGSNLISAKPERDVTGTSGWVVAFELDSVGAKAFADATTRLVGQPISIYMDEDLISSPNVESAITEGSGIITGSFNSESATKLANQISAGALPFALHSDNYRTISPQLGSNALSVMVTAGILSFCLICVFLLCYYRMSGVVACIALLLQIAGQLIMLTWPQFTITLPGIAGIILSIGMGVDANIIAAERIREEIRSGKTIEASVSAGFKNAFSSIFDGNITVLIVAVIMLMFGSGAILSFAYTLLFGIIMNFVAGVTATRLMTMSLVQFKPIRSAKMFLSNRALNKKPWTIDFYKNRKIYYSLSAVIISVGIVFCFVKGVELDIQFSGGAIFSYDISENTELNPDAAANVASGAIGNRPITGQITEDYMTKDKRLSLSLAGDTLTEEELSSMTAALLAAYPEQNVALVDSNNVAPFFGEKFLRNGIIAIVLSFLLIIVYVSISFRKLHGISAGVMSLVSLFHDVIVVFFVFVIFGIPIGDSFIAVALTILGYSINDTIVIYDRIRENTLNRNFTSTEDLVNKSISQSFTRSLNTNIAVFAAVAIVYIFAAGNGLDSIQSFALPMAIGTISGCYSTVCIAGPSWAMWQKRKEKKKLATAR